MACVFDRTVGACYIICSPRHLTSHLFHSYISTHSLQSHWPFSLLCFVSFCVILGRYRLRAWSSKTTRQTSISSYTNRIRTETSQCIVYEFILIVIYTRYYTVTYMIHENYMYPVPTHKANLSLIIASNFCSRSSS